MTYKHPVVKYSTFKSRRGASWGWFLLPKTRWGEGRGNNSWEAFAPKIYMGTIPSRWYFLSHWQGMGSGWDLPTQVASLKKNPRRPPHPRSPTSKECLRGSPDHPLTQHCIMLNTLAQSFHRDESSNSIPEKIGRSFN